MENKIHSMIKAQHGAPNGALGAVLDAAELFLLRKQREQAQRRAPSLQLLGIKCRMLDVDLSPAQRPVAERRR